LIFAFWLPYLQRLNLADPGLALPLGMDHCLNPLASRTDQVEALPYPIYRIVAVRFTDIGLEV